MGELPKEYTKQCMLAVQTSEKQKQHAQRQIPTNNITEQSFDMKVSTSTTTADNEPDLSVSASAAP